MPHDSADQAEGGRMVKEPWGGAVPSIMETLLPICFPATKMGSEMSRKLLIQLLFHAG